MAGDPIQRLLIVQHGDYAEAYRRFREGGAETYRDQRKSVEFVASLAPAIETTTLALAPEPYEAELAPNLRAMAIPPAALDARRIAALFETVRPDALILRTPHIGLLEEASRRGVRMLPVFADIFEKGGLRRFLWIRRLRRLLSGRTIPCIANHSLNASRSLVSALDIPPRRIVPWDWSPIPLAGPAKAGMADCQRPSAFYAGMLSVDKGVGDCLHAVARLRARGIAVTMEFAGPGDRTAWEADARKLRVADAVQFLGQIPNTEVRNRMRRHDLVIVPSRHSYAEGLPNTIYEALASRSVLVISDHPAFRGRLKPGEDCLMYTAADPGELANAIAWLAEDPARYGVLSENTERALEGLYVGLPWEELIGFFLEDPADRSGWVARNSLAALGR